MTKSVRPMPAGLQNKEDSVRELRRLKDRRSTFKHRAGTTTASIRKRTKQIRLHCCSDITEHDVCSVHIHQADQPLRSRAKWLFTQVHEHVHKTEWTVPDLAVPLCTTCWLAYNGIGKTQYYRTLAMKKLGLKRLPSKTYKSRRQVSKTLRTRVWIKQFVKMVGDHMPHEKAIQLPVTRLSELHQVYIDEWMLTDVDTPLRYPAFLKEVRRSENKLLVTKRKQFSQCDICNYNKQQQAKQKTNPKAHRYKQLQDKHRAHVAVSKEKYYKHCGKSKSVMYTGKYLSIIFDGMDQAKTRIPHLNRVPKCVDKTEQLKTHVTGVIVHGYIHRIYTWVDNFPKDANMSATILMEILKELLEMDEIKGQGGLPRKLYLQLDNCGSENKNKYFMTFLAVLVHLGVFEKIKVSFLMVGHTHEDIDQFFSRLSVLWNPVDMYSIPQLLEVAGYASFDATKVQRSGRKSMEEGQPKCVDHRMLTSSADIKTWLKPLDQAWSGIQKFRAFVFDKNADGEVLMRVRSCMCSASTHQCPEQHKYWQPRHEGGDAARDGFRLFTPAQADALDPARISKVSPKALDCTRAVMHGYFSKLLAYGRSFDKQAVDTDVDDEEDPQSSADDSDAVDNRDNKARKRQRDKLTEGIEWFEAFFDDQDIRQSSMCETCRDFREREAIAKKHILQEEIVKGMEGAMERVRMRQEAISDDSDVDKDVDKNGDKDGDKDGDGEPDEVGGADDEDEADEEEKLEGPHDVGLGKKSKQPKNKGEAELRAVRKELSAHMLDAIDDDAHGFFDAGNLFDQPDRMVVEDANDLEEEPDYIVEDVHQCPLQIGGKRLRRKAHPVGCLVGDVVVCKGIDKEHPFFVGVVLRRSDDDPQRKIDIHYYGNANMTFDKVYMPGWLDKDGDAYFKKKMQHKSHTMYEGETWIQSIITWSCDWTLNKSKQLPVEARARCEFTLGKDVYKKPQPKKKKK